MASEPVQLVNKLVDAASLCRDAAFVIGGCLTKLVSWLCVPKRARTSAHRGIYRTMVDHA